MDHAVHHIVCFSGPCSTPYCLLLCILQYTILFALVDLAVHHIVYFSGPCSTPYCLILCILQYTILFTLVDLAVHHIVYFSGARQDVRPQPSYMGQQDDRSTLPFFSFPRLIFKIPSLVGVRAMGYEFKFLWLWGRKSIEIQHCGEENQVKISMAKGIRKQKIFHGERKQTARMVRNLLL